MTFAEFHHDRVNFLQHLFIPEQFLFEYYKALDLMLIMTGVMTNTDAQNCHPWVSIQN